MSRRHPHPTTGGSRGANAASLSAGSLSRPVCVSGNSASPWGVSSLNFPRLRPGAFSAAQGASRRAPTPPLAPRDRGASCLAEPMEG